MSSMFAPNTQALINGGTFTQVYTNDGNYQRFRDASDILHRTTATAAFHNSDERFDPPKCHPNTRLAVLTKIMKWIQWGDDLEAFIMWVYGPAGAGKSAIAQTIAEMCEEEMILLASFFFSRNDPSRSTIKPLIATIAYQITSNLPDAREAILGAIERDPLIFSKSLAIQVKSLIIGPLQPLIDKGYFSNSTSRRLIIIDGLDECFDPKVQQHVVEVLANAQQQHQLPLIFLIASRPQQQISFAFSTGVLPSVTTRLALDDSYHPDKDIELFLTDKFQEIKSTHPRRAYIPPQWPLPDILNQLVEKSSGQFIYASTVIHYVTSIRHKPTDRLNIVLGIRPPHRDLPFSELDALYAQILGGVEDIEHVLDILGAVLFGNCWLYTAAIEEFLSLQPGDVELYLADLSSLITINDDDPWGQIRILHASFSDFLMDPTRSKTSWINPRARHTAFACRCLQILQLETNAKLLSIGYRDLVYHLENAEMTPELSDELINFSFNSLQDVIKEYNKLNGSWKGSIHYSVACFLECLKRLSFPGSKHIYQKLQADFDRMLYNALEKYHFFSGFALLLGSILRYMNLKQKSCEFPPGLVASLYLLRQEEDGDILGDMRFYNVTSFPGLTSTRDFFTYFIELLENPERSGTHSFDPHKYATAAKECLQLCLCSHHKFSKGVTESALHDKVLLRNKPWAWKARSGVHSRIRKAIRHLTVRLWKSFESGRKYVHWYPPFLPSVPEHECYRLLSYHWALDLLPFLLERSGISSELVDILHRRATFTTMAQEFPRRTMLAKEAIAKYLLRAEEPAVKQL